MKFFYTCRFHPNDLNSFESFLSIFLVLIKSLVEKKKIIKYRYVIEKDETPSRHLHLLFESKHKDRNALMKFFQKQKDLQIFKKFLFQETETDPNRAFCINTVKSNEQNPKQTWEYYIGYTYKEEDIKRQGDNLSHAEIMEGIKYYQAVEISTAKTQENDWRYIKSNQIHMELDRLYKEDPDILNTTEKITKYFPANKISLNQINSKVLRLSLAEWRVSQGFHDYHDDGVLHSHVHDLKSSNEDQMLDACAENVRELISKYKIDYDDINEDLKYLLSVHSHIQ